MSNLGDLGFTPQSVQKKLCLLRFWNRLIKMDSGRLTKYIFNKDYEKKGKWCTYIYEILTEIDHQHVYNDKLCCEVDSCKEALLSKFTEKWKSDIKRKPKLCTYCLLKENFTTEKYVY